MRHREALKREQRLDGAWKLSAGGVSYTVTRLRPGAMRVSTQGFDRGETASQFVSLTVNVARHFSRTGELIRAHSDAATFEAAAARLVPSLERLPAPDAGR
jgi:hypothetical protein